MSKKNREKTHAIPPIGGGKPKPVVHEAKEEEFVLNHSHDVNGNKFAPGVYRLGQMVGTLPVTEELRDGLMARDAMAG